MLELADLLGFIHISEYQNIHAFIVRKTNEAILPILQDELKDDGTEYELAKLPAGTVIVNNTSKAQKQPKEIFYLQKSC